MSFGTDLQAEREKLGVPLSSLAEATKVSVRNLEALECDDFEHLPGGVFQRGIVRSYCGCLGLDEKEWLDRFASSSKVREPEQDWVEFAENVKRSRLSGGSGNRLRWWGVAALLLSLVAIGWAVWRYIVHPHMHGG